MIFSHGKECLCTDSDDVVHILNRLFDNCTVFLGTGKEEQGQGKRNNKLFHKNLLQLTAAVGKEYHS
jgi:hypothetical protein